MTKKCREQLDYTLATHAIEKLSPSQAALRLCEKISEGTIAADDAVSAILKQYGLKQVRANG